ncbi:MAG: aminotransferase class I/II-fold pyridoxal phosphate-dependent enzyme, partial [Gimesia chilikensis]
TFVCAPHPVQWAGLAALDYDISGRVEEYKEKRDLMRDLLSDRFEIAGAQGAFYMFVKAPWGTGTEFCTEAIKNNLLIIPGNVFSNQDTHFRISYAQENPVLEAGAEILNRLADSKG